VSTPVEVQVDRDDDIAVVRALQRLALRAPGLCVAAVPPDSRLSVALRWAILRALGKRSQRLHGIPQWHDVTRWLAAHCITELVLLRAQHLSELVRNELTEEVAGRLGVRVVLVYSGTNHASAVTYPSVDLVTLTTRAWPSLQPQRREPDWPAVPRVHPLRVRHDARAKLSEREFQDVQRLLAAACSAMSTWLLHHAGASSSQIAAAYEVVSAGLDEDHAFIRRSGADIALLTAGARIEPGARLTAQPHQLSASDLAKLLEFTDPRTAALHLARQLTGLADDLVTLVAGDQISDHQILNRRAPDEALPILRALDRGFGPVFDVRPDLGRVKSYAARAPATNSGAAATLAWLFESGRNAVRVSDLAGQTRTELDELDRQGLVVIYDDAYRASDVALYGAFQRAAATPRSC
jgi:hypothetical protein